MDRRDYSLTRSSIPSLNDHERALQNGAITAEHPEEQVEIQKRARSFELHRASTASRRGQRRDRPEIGAGADAIGRRVDGPGDREGGVWGGNVDVDLDLGDKGVNVGAGRGDDDLARSPLRHGRQLALCVCRIGLRHGG
jgi:hypothetical protein